ncbi:FMN-binding protein [Lacrimispora sphenoides]|uniref:Fumarate reductase flavoprotein subunit n=1 Tax=Lacrimispora sphenoides JCM 1415 TaxID=1297793 RepID=A0ABY1CCY6_9FIRM|nr:FMN-binding protein [Lacrimispora sphenoides]SET93073.1 fumarate reductase flavoprotein subunit [[Clostridium] sphenoides JCM 1415]SUY52464.1 fumarate reductase flavoprotein subunit precursor [Lacrimispora sphenoides]
MKKMTLAIAAALCILALFAGCGGSSDTYKAGTYTAAAEGYAGDVEVEVEFDQDSLLSVKITDHNETVGIGDRAIEELPAKIVEELTWEVDAVASATVTSDAIKTAVKDCIEQAKSK